MYAKLASIPVADQDTARKFYTEMLGFSVVHDIPMGPFRWLTVTPPGGIEGIELVLEPMGFPPAAAYYKALFEAGIPVTALFSTDIVAEHEELVRRGVVFRHPPKDHGTLWTALFEDTCGNVVNLVQVK